MIRRILFFISLLLLLWAAACTALPFFFLRFLENKYSVTLSGQKYPAWIEPRIFVKNAAFAWQDRVELLPSDLDVRLDMQAWLKLRKWRVQLKGDGAALKFLGDWRRKTGVEAVKAQTLRLDLDFSAEGISEIRNVELVSPEYKFQIAAREKSRT